MQFLRRFACAGFAVLLVTGAVAAAAQVVPSSAVRGLSVTVGGLGSDFQAYYAGGDIARIAPNRVYGVAAYVDVRFTRWVQVEADGRWLPFNGYLGIKEDNYLIGPRIPVYHVGHATPYIKVLIGLGNVSFLNDAANIIAYGGGLDYRLDKRMSLRVVDIEYQQWRVSPTLFPYGVSAGVGFHIF